MRDLQRSHLQLQARNGNDAWEVLTLCLQLQSFKFCLSSAKILHVDPSDQATSSPTYFPLFLVLDTTIACYCQVCSSNDVEAEHPIVKMLQWSMQCLICTGSFQPTALRVIHTFQKASHLPYLSQTSYDGRSIAEVGEMYNVSRKHR